MAFGKRGVHYTYTALLSRKQGINEREGILQILGTVRHAYLSTRKGKQGTLANRPESPHRYTLDGEVYHENKRRACEKNTHGSLSGGG